MSVKVTGICQPNVWPADITDRLFHYKSKVRKVCDVRVNAGAISSSLDMIETSGINQS